MNIHEKFSLDVSTVRYLYASGRILLCRKSSEMDFIEYYARGIINAIQSYNRRDHSQCNDQYSVIKRQILGVIFCNDLGWVILLGFFSAFTLVNCFDWRRNCESEGDGNIRLRSRHCWMMTVGRFDSFGEFPLPPPFFCLGRRAWFCR
jgi:hypothetical protein